MSDHGTPLPAARIQSGAGWAVAFVILLIGLGTVLLLGGMNILGSGRTAPTIAATATLSADR